MKAPDKIYGEVNDNGFVCGYADPTKSDDIEYIRKDVLCHWIHGQIRTLRTSEASGLCMGQDVAIYTLEKVIEKINSL